MGPRLQAAQEALRRGEIVLLYDADGREEETDMVLAAQHATTSSITTMRRDAGGLLCATLAPEDHRRLGLPFLTDIIQGAARHHPVLELLLPDDIRYDGAKPAFGLTINHRSTFTGITDADRAATISELAALVSDRALRSSEDAQAAFGAAFRAPGHVSLLNGAARGLADRQGHTELSTELMRQAGLTPSAVLCEMLAPDGRAMAQKEAQAYAQENGRVFLTGREVIDAWKRRTQKAPLPAQTGRRPSDPISA